MEGSSSAQPCGSKSNPMASKLLANLPSRGLLSSAAISSNPGGMRVYMCDHDTAPPEGQLIKTNQQNILIRALTLRKQRGETSSKNAKGVTSGEGSSRKRASERLLDNGGSAKRPSSHASSRQDGSNANIADQDLHILTVERLRALLRERGLSQRGKKDELITRLKNGSS
ncbi:hypothetical protein SAY87_021794 [Trapa incisa]|uniref:SAP domain-containing protein n=2 Tax=Trapa TaxID=22665 RepID=A0AAN7N5Z7_TRANT|nr:hypothetical protein SAY87_021794 [Trapa incisa]KAK4804308.1 hypothetical protein SAY86_004125 [Trapa natans]